MCSDLVYLTGDEIKQDNKQFVVPNIYSLLFTSPFTVILDLFPPQFPHYFRRFGAALITSTCMQIDVGLVGAKFYLKLRSASSPSELGIGTVQDITTLSEGPRIGFKSAQSHTAPVPGLPTFLVQLDFRITISNETLSIILLNRSFTSTKGDFSQIRNNGLWLRLLRRAASCCCRTQI